jgi:mono/diheme cytochrome c family protein
MRALVLTLVAFALPAFPADSCPVTKAPAPAFVPPSPYNPNPLSGGFLLGTGSLWTFVNTYDFSLSHRYWPFPFKLVYWHPGVNWHHTDEANDLTVVARRLDAPSVPIVFAHRASIVGKLSDEAPDEFAMMTGFDLTSGCWEIAADFRGEYLSYVISLRRSVWGGVYSPEQAKDGQALYNESCSSCHGNTLIGQNRVPALVGPQFLSNWNGLTLGDLFERIRTTMPQQTPGSLSRDKNAAILAYILSVNQFPARITTALSQKTEVLEEIWIYASERENSSR